VSTVNPHLFFHTVRYLRPRQVIYRVARALLPFLRLPGPLGPYRLRPRASEPAAEPRNDGFDGSGFTFLNRRLPFSGPERWRQPGADRLWTYNLHAFRFLSGIEPRDGLFLVLDWIEENTDPKGPGWEPYPLSIRIREWIEWVHSNRGLDEAAAHRIVDSIARQTAALEAQIEYHLMGNHLLENAVTLCWAGLSLDGERASQWVRRGLPILREELATQVLPDGAHDERSPMYQALLAEALLRLAGVADKLRSRDAETIGHLSQSAGMNLLGSLTRLVHPDGDYALLNDCALGVAPTCGALMQRFIAGRYPGMENLEARLGTWALADAGYFGWRDGDGTCLVFDSGPIGPDHQPGHGHADALSFELSRRGMRAIADTGVFTYNPCPVRQYDRGTAAHNTIQVDGRDQSELWESFRCARRISIRSAGTGFRDGGLELHGSYGGPGRSGQTVIHTRSIRIEPPVIGFRDELTAPGRHQAVLRVHLAPGLTCSPEPDGWKAAAGSEALARVSGRGFSFDATTTPYHPRFGVEIDRPALSAAFGFHDRLELNWFIHLL